MVVKCRTLDGMDDKSKRETLKNWNILNNLQYPLGTEDSDFLDGFEDRVALALYDFEWDNNKNNVEYQTERVMCTKGPNDRYVHEIAEIRTDMIADRMVTIQEIEVPMSSLYLPFIPLNESDEEESNEED